MNKYTKWFGRVVLLGFLLTNVFAVPGIFKPTTVADLIDVPPPAQPVWLAFAFLLTFLVSLFYIPASLAPLQYLPTSLLTVASRFVLAFFWLFLYCHHATGPTSWLWKMEICLGIVQLVLLILAVRKPSTPTA